jgi:Hsp90 protein
VHSLVRLQVIKALNGLIQADSSSDRAKEITNLMYETALLTSGFDVEAPKDYAAKVYGMMGLALSQDAAVADAAGKTSGKETPTKGPGKRVAKDTSRAVDADQVIEEE